MQIRVEELYQQILSFLTMYGLKVLAALVILFVGRFAAGIARNLIDKILERSKTDPIVRSFIKSLVFASVITFAVVAALSEFGVETASFIAVIGAGAFAVGLALQGSLGDFAAGILLLINRPFKVGDYVEVAGTAGVVREIQLFTTILNTLDNIKVIIPNGKINGNVIKNYSSMEKRRIDLTVGIGYTSSIADAMEILNDILRRDSRILDEPSPVVAVAELGDSSVNLAVRPWVKPADYWDVKFDLTRSIKEVFDENGIEIPFPQQVVYVRRNAS